MMFGVHWRLLALAASCLAVAIAAGSLGDWAKAHRPSDTTWIAKLEIMFWGGSIGAVVMGCGAFARLPGNAVRAVVAACGMCGGAAIIGVSRLPRVASLRWRGRPLPQQLRAAGLGLLGVSVVGAAVTGLLAAMSTSEG